YYDIASGSTIVLVAGAMFVVTFAGTAALKRRRLQALESAGSTDVVGGVRAGLGPVRSTEFQHVSQTPEIAKCVRSAWNPWVSSIIACSLVASSSDRSSPAPHREHVRCTWPASSARWYSAPPSRWACARTPISSRSASVRYTVEGFTPGISPWMRRASAVG